MIIPWQWRTPWPVWAFITWEQKRTMKCCIEQFSRWFWSKIKYHFDRTCEICSHHNLTKGIFYFFAGVWFSSLGTNKEWPVCGKYSSCNCSIVTWNRQAKLYKIIWNNLCNKKYTYSVVKLSLNCRKNILTTKTIEHSLILL